MFFSEDGLKPMKRIQFLLVAICLFSARCDQLKSRFSGSRYEKSSFFGLLHFFYVRVKLRRLFVRQDRPDQLRQQFCQSGPHVVDLDCIVALHLLDRDAAIRNPVGRAGLRQPRHAFRTAPRLTDSLSAITFWLMRLSCIGSLLNIIRLISRLRTPVSVLDRNSVIKTVVEL